MVLEYRFAEVCKYLGIHNRDRLRRSSHNLQTHVCLSHPECA